MAKSLGNQPLVNSMLKDDSILIEVGGSVRRIKLSNLAESLNQGDELMLSQVAWGIPIKHASQSSPAWGRVGNLGMWEEYKRMTGRYLVKNNGDAAPLHPNDSSRYADGSVLDESKGHVMVISPRLYFRVQEDTVTGIPTLWLSMLPIGGNYIGTADNGMYNVQAAYMGRTVSGAMVSRSGLVPTGTKTISAFWADAQANGSDWGLYSYDHMRLNAMHGLSIAGNADIQETVGYGLGGSSSSTWDEGASSRETGDTVALGNGTGKVDVNFGVGTKTCQVSLMGVEGLWNWRNIMTQGVYFGSSANSAQSGSEIFIYEGNRMPSTAELAAKPAGVYRELVRPTSSGYIKEVHLGENFDVVAKTLGGGSTSYWCDYHYGNATGQLFLVGGSAHNASGAGFVSVYSNYDFGSSNSARSSRLAYYGKLNFIKGREM